MEVHLLIPEDTPDTPLDRWISSHAAKGSGWVGTSELYASWKAYSEEHQEYTGSISKFSRELSRRGWVKMRSYSGTKAGFAGRRLK